MVTVRTYKSFLTAIANSFSLIKLTLYIVGIVIKYHIKYSIEEVVIGKNFYFDTTNTTNNFHKSDYKQSLINKKPVLEFTEACGLRKSSQRGKLNIKGIYLNITCWRYFVCRKRNEHCFSIKKPKRSFLSILVLSVF
jgi:hypothetical protein